MGVWVCGSEECGSGRGNGRERAGRVELLYLCKQLLCVPSAVPVQVSEGPPLADVVSAALCHKYNSEQAASAGK